MEGILLTIGAVAVIAAGLVWLARSWPRSSTHTGYNVWMNEESRGRGVTTPEDERPWHLGDRDGGGPKA